MKEYLFIFIGSLILYFFACFFNEVRYEVVFINITSPFRRILAPSGNVVRFTISGVITELFAHVSILANIVLIIKELFFPSVHDIRMFNRAWVMLALVMLGAANEVESFFRCKSMKMGKEKVSLIITMVMVGVSTLLFFVMAAIMIFLYVKGAQWNFSG